MIQDTDIQKGDILISKPSILGDVTFNRSIILIADNNAEGIVGFIINKPLEDNLQDLIPNVKSSFKVFDGGPVERDKLYFIHNVPELIKNGLKISDGIYWGGQYQEVINLINTGQLNHSQIKFFLGYTGWAQTQLNDEIKEEAWLKDDEIKTQDIINCNSASFWNKIMKSIGGQYLIWSNAPENPNYN